MQESKSVQIGRALLDQSSSILLLQTYKANFIKCLQRSKQEIPFAQNKVKTNR